MRYLWQLPKQLTLECAASTTNDISRHLPTVLTLFENIYSSLTPSPLTYIQSVMIKNYTVERMQKWSIGCAKTLKYLRDATELLYKNRRNNCAMSRSKVPWGSRFLTPWKLFLPLSLQPSRHQRSDTCYSILCQWPAPAILRPECLTQSCSPLKWVRRQQQGCFRSSYSR